MSQSSSRIVWIVSYPKSGNTWFRILLNYIIQGVDEELDINSLSFAPMATQRKVFDQVANLISSEMTAEEIDDLRPDVYRHIARTAKTLCYFKVHEAFRCTSRQKFLFPPDATHAVIYLIRNPLDVAPSFANHLCVSVDDAIFYMSQNFSLFDDSQGRPCDQFPQMLQSWSGHVKSWTKQWPGSAHVIRYEDLLLDPLPNLRHVAGLLNIELSDEGIAKAYELSQFDRLKNQEREAGFREKPNVCTSFFRRGQSGGWREELTTEQVSRIVVDHDSVMRDYGYLAKN